MPIASGKFPFYDDMVAQVDDNDKIDVLRISLTSQHKL